MPLARGTRCGPYEILAPLGAGGMGEVYRARDTRLHRDVAIKALPAEFASDAERLARFQREARLLGSLNHPNIAAIYGLEEADGARFLVLEIVEGESLAQKLAAGPLPLEEALSVCSQIAAGVSAAHEAGVIHRDLKPGNIMIRSDGSVKVLDFGLAKGTDVAVPAGNLSASPTVTAGTETGVILGTAAYMSPEQARGRPLDKRTDIWSFGCILYECLTSRQLFRDETVSDTLASIIRSEPDWSALPPETPARVRDLLRRCLQKDARRRLHDIADAGLEIEEALSGAAEKTAVTMPSPPASAHRGRAAAWIAFGFVGGALAATAFRGLSQHARRSESPRAVHSAIQLPPGSRLPVATQRMSLAFSPDGRRLAFRGVRGNVTQLYLRDLGRTEATPIPGTEGAADPFFSPDGEWLGFFAGWELKKVALAGGAPSVLAGAPPVAEGGTWSSDGSIVFAPRLNGGLARLPAGTKRYEVFTTPDAARGERALLWPQMLPDGQSLLLVVRAGRDFDDIAASNIVIHSLRTGTRRVLIEGASYARYAEPGYLIFLKGTTVFAASCDSRTWTLTGHAVPLARNVLTSLYDTVPFLAVSDAGLLAYAVAADTTSGASDLLWVDRSGREEPLPVTASFLSCPRLSPDGSRVAIVTRQSDNPRGGVAIFDFARGVLSPLTPEPGRHFSPAWSHDGRRLAFTAFETGEPRLAWKASDGSGQIEFLSDGMRPEFPTSWSPDGRTLLYTAAAPGSIENMDLWALSVEGQRQHRVWLGGPARELAAFLSPDGRAVVYVSNESRRPEVYAQPYPGLGPKIKVSADGGSEPAWSPKGGEIFYRTADTLMAAPVQTQPELKVGAPRAVIPDRYDRWGREDSSRNYDVAPDGRRFLVIKSREGKQEPVTQLNLITNWPAEVETAPAAKK